VVFAPANEELSVRGTRLRADGGAVPHEGQPAQLAGLGDVPTAWADNREGGGEGWRELAKILFAG